MANDTDARVAAADERIAALEERADELKRQLLKVEEISAGTIEALQKLNARVATLEGTPLD